MSWDWLYGPEGVIYRPPTWCSADSLNTHPEYTRVCSQMAQDNANALVIFAVLLILALTGLVQMFSGLTGSRRRDVSTESGTANDFYIPPQRQERPEAIPRTCTSEPTPLVACSMQTQMLPMMTSTSHRDQPVVLETFGIRRKSPHRREIGDRPVMTECNSFELELIDIAQRAPSTLDSVAGDWCIRSDRREVIARSIPEGTTVGPARRVLVLGDVGRNATVVAEGGGARIEVMGNVLAGARIGALGGGAHILIRGNAAPDTFVYAQGGSARIEFLATPSSNAIAEGGSAEVLRLGAINVR